MCTATAQLGFLNSDLQQQQERSTTNSKRPIQSAAVQFAMKLRFNAQLTSSTVAGALRGQQEQNDIITNKTSPRASNGVVSVNVSNRSRGNNNMRRSQSARGCRPRSTNSALHNSRSHSQEQITSAQHPARTQELPIPGGVDHRASLLSLSVDKNDLTKMYDYATWNMYERIVSARRRRLSEMDQQPSSSSIETSSTKMTVISGHAKSAVATTRPIAIDTTKQHRPLYKSTSQDESSTAATSTASSSWSRTDSPMTFLPNLENQRGSSCPPPATVGAEEDHFIFQLDM